MNRPIKMANEETEFWRAHRQAVADTRSTKRQEMAKALREAGIEFEEHNDGAHLVLTVGEHKIDYWPGTGRWNVRNAIVSGRGIVSLLTRCARLTESK